MAGQERVLDSNCVLLNGVAHQLEHGALFLLSPLFCGLICMFWCSLLHMFHDASIIRRRSLLLRQLRFRNFQVSDGGNQQLDVQQLSPKQTSPLNSSNRLSRKLSRRTSGLEQDSNLCQRKLVDSEKELLNCQKENIKLQEELSEVNLFKNKLADLLKRENEERAKLEKQQSVFQSQALTATFERDRLMSEVDKLQRKEDEMTEKLTDLQERLDQTESKYFKERSLCADLQRELEESNQEVALYRKVIEKFWRVRTQASEVQESASNKERASTLLHNDEGYWSYGDLNKYHFDEATQARENLVNLQREFDMCRNSLVNCQAEYLEESNARKHAEDALVECRQQLVTLAKQVNFELQQLSSIKASLKEDVAVFCREETNQILSLQEALQHISKEAQGARGGDLKASCLQESSGIDMNISCSTEDSVLKTVIEGANVHAEVSKVDELCNRESENGNYICSNDNDDKVTSNELDSSTNDQDSVDSSTNDQDSVEEATMHTRDAELTKAVLTTCDEIANLKIKISSDKEDDVMQEDNQSGKKDVAVDESSRIPKDDSKEALAQALQEKVAALLLLSQQEERHILESNTAVVLESEISSLKQQLLQVTSEKVDALMELARAHEELRKLQETFKQTTQYGRTLSSGQLTPVEDYSIFFDHGKNSMAAESAKKASNQSYLKQLWLKGPELGARTKSLSHMLTLRSSKEADAVGIARLRVENATLRESLTSIRHLCKSTNRLRLTIARVAADSSAQTESSIQAAVEAVDGVISEALHLKVALHTSLPVDDLGWNSIGSPLARASEIDPESPDYDANDDLHIVSFFGLEIVRLVLLAAQLQKRFLGQNV